MNKLYDNFENLTCDTYITDQKADYYAFDQTVFYGEKGGMTADQGTINGQPVLDLKWIGDTVYHKVAQPLQDPIHLQVDWPTRLTNTAVQSVFHLLTGYYEDHTPYRKVEDSANPDNQWYEINTKNVTAADLKRVEDHMNAVINADVKTEIHYIAGRDYPDPKYAIHPTLRIVKFGDLNEQPCATPHVNHTGQIQSFVILDTKKTALGTRIFFSTGLATNRRLKRNYEGLKQVANTLGVKKNEAPARAQLILDENKQLEHQVAELKQALMANKAATIAQTADSLVEVRDVDTKDLGLIAHQLLNTPGVTTLMLTTDQTQVKKGFVLISTEERAQAIFQDLQAAGQIHGGGTTHQITGVTTLSFADLKTALTQSLAQAN